MCYDRANRFEDIKMREQVGRASQVWKGVGAFPLNRSGSLLSGRGYFYAYFYAYYQAFLVLHAEGAG